MAIDKSKIPIVQKQKYIPNFLKLIEIRLQKELPDKANEWEMTEKAFEIFHKGLNHLRKDERMTYE